MPFKSEEPFGLKCPFNRCVPIDFLSEDARLRANIHRRTEREGKEINYFCPVREMATFNCSLEEKSNFTIDLKWLK